MGILDQPLVVVVLVMVGATAFWWLTRRAGSAEQMGADGVDRMDEGVMWWSFRERARREAAAKERRGGE
ncbi:MAG: hypothetical protein ACR2NO_08205 [Chloroflexota bacterium]